ncbi:MAG: type II 3-dehydroquinate dehydratase [Clostridia bacterium]|nr:type II 3-dehydroquinate dehydratase [Clostridia bacterium]
MIKILVLNGPNLNMLGIREPSIYGYDTLDSINNEIKEYADTLGVYCDFYQSNHEGDLVDKIQSVYTEYDGCVINAGAYTHYSYAIRDAIASVGKPFIEVHISDISAREDFRHKSVITEVCKKIIAGYGKEGYKMAVKAVMDILNG